MYNRLSSRNRIALAALLAILIALPSGCVNRPTSPTTAPTTTHLPGDPVYGGTIVVGIQQEPVHFNPYLAQAAGDREILFNVYEGLYKSDAAGTMRPALALSYTMSADAMLYTFTLRPNVRFHDGRVLTAEDVVYSFSLAMAPGSIVTGLGNIERVTAPDAQTVEIRLLAPDVELLPFMGCPIVPAGTDDLDNHPVGTGPFRFSSYEIGQKVTLTRYEDYWLSGRPYVDRVDFRVLTDPDAAFLELKSGAIDIFPYLSFERADEISARFEAREDIKNMVQLLALNNARPPFDDVRVRRALSLAIDRQGVLDLTNEGHGARLISGLSPAMGDYYNTALDARFEPDLDAARQLLTEAGYPDGFDTTITVPSNYAYHVNTAIVLANQLKAVGVRATIQQVDWGTWLDVVYKGRDYDTTVIALTSEFTPKDVLSRYVSTAGDNFVNFASDAYDQLFSTIQPLTDLAARIDGYRRLQEILADEAASVFLQDPVTMVAVAKPIAGYETYRIYAQDLSGVWRLD